MALNKLWTEAYRPTTLDGYVFKDGNQKKRIQQWISDGELPHCLLSGSPGTGKSTLIKILLNELKINPFDILEVNASKDNGVDFIRAKITSFAENMGYGEMKYIFLDEADGLSPTAQGVLRGIIEKYAGSVRFLLTCNYLNKIIPAIQSRTETGKMHLDKLDTDEFTLRLCNILIAENIDIDIDVVDAIVKYTYPDLRRGISALQSHVIDGKLVLPEKDEAVDDYRVDVLAKFRAGKYREAREQICSQALPEEYDDIFTFLYQNVEIWGDDFATQARCIMAIRDGIVKHSQVADIEINLAATLSELELIATGKV